MSESALGKATGSSDADDKESSVPVHHREEWLRRHYWDKEMSVYEMADVADVSARTIGDWMNKKGVEKRGNHKRAHAVANGNSEEAKRYRSKEWLRTQYVEENRSVIEMADVAGVTPTSICNWMDAAGIETRGPHQRSHIVQSDVTEILTDGAWLREQYVEKELSTLEIAERAGCTPATVSNWMEKHGIDARGPFECKPRGEDHPHWAGGHSLEYGPEWREKREKAIQRDGESCRRCGAERSTVRDRTRRDLHVHHIQKLKTFDNPSDAHELDNLLTVCSGCHAAIEGLPIDTR